jgi:hypothetical protein
MGLSQSLGSGPPWGGTGRCGFDAPASIASDGMLFTISFVGTCGMKGKNKLGSFSVLSVRAMFARPNRAAEMPPAPRPFPLARVNTAVS